MSFYEVHIYTAVTWGQSSAAKYLWIVRAGAAACQGQKIVDYQQRSASNPAKDLYTPVNTSQNRQAHTHLHMQAYIN